jgi:hypothetical protein
MRRRTKQSVRRHAHRRDQDGDSDYIEAVEDVPEAPAHEDTGACDAELSHAPPEYRVAPALDLDEHFARPGRPARSNRRVFLAALAFSAVLHLSMVTVFSIVILFPRNDVKYYDLSIVRVPSARSTSTGEDLPTGSGGRLRLSALDPAADTGLKLNGSPADTPLTPGITLPTVDFAELDRLRVRHENLASSKGYDDLFSASPRDSWERFGLGLKSLGSSLSRLAMPEESGSTPLAEAPPDSAVSTLRPADGFEAEIEWNGAPRDRRLLFAPPIKALWNVDPATLKRPVEIVFTVNPHGRVVSVWSPALDDTGLVDRVQAGILKYRFEPLPSETGAAPSATAGLGVSDSANQLGTFYLRPARSGP